MSMNLMAAGIAAWTNWDPEALERACEALRGDASDLSRWRALACVMLESADALPHLEQAHAGHLAQGRVDCAGVDALLAVTLCVLDVGAMDQVVRWLERLPEPGTMLATDRLSLLWQDMGRVAQAALGGDGAAAQAAGQALRERLHPLRQDLTPDERLMVAQLLVNHYFQTQQFEQFDWLSTVVESAPAFDRASALSRARWLYHSGYALYQIGEHGRAEKAWRRALAAAEAGGLDSMRLLALLAAVRLLIDEQRLDAAEAILGEVQPQWGAGRTAQLIQLQQMRARLQLLRRQPVRAYATLGEALALAEASAVFGGEQASCLTDLAQVLIALKRVDDAQDLLAQLVDRHEGRNAQVYRCLGSLLAATRVELHTPEQRRERLREGMALARQIRYTMFFRLLPALAGQACALALQWQIEASFAEEVARSRDLPAPPDAGLNWPWTLHVRMIGGFELRGLISAPGKTQHKPLELLRLLACSRRLALGQQQLMDALWPEAEGDGARKSLDMAVQRLRRLLGDPGLVIVADSRVALDPTRVCSDVQQRRELIEQLDILAMGATRHGAEDQGLAAACAELVRRIIELTRGDLLPGLAAGAWLEAERRAVGQDTVRAALLASKLMDQIGAVEDDITLLLVAFSIEPMAEPIARRLMLAHDRLGHSADIARVYGRLRQQLREMGLRPGAEIEALWARLQQRHRL